MNVKATYAVRPGSRMRVLQILRLCLGGYQGVAVGWGWVGGMWVRKLKDLEGYRLRYWNKLFHAKP